MLEKELGVLSLAVVVAVVWYMARVVVVDMLDSCMPLASIRIMYIMNLL